MWDQKAPRPAEEIARYDNKRVVVTGKLVPDTPDPPFPMAHLIGPCMLTIDSIELAP